MILIKNKQRLLGFIILFLMRVVIATPVNPKLTDGEVQQQILADINNYRITQNLLPLKMSKIISEEARQHSTAMADNKVPFSHVGFHERMQYLFKKLPSATAYAENVAYTSGNARAVVKQWLKSPGHRRNIQGNYNLTGIGIAHGKHGLVYVTQIFVKGLG